MTTIAYIIIALILIGIVVLIATILMFKKKKEQQTMQDIDYRAFFIMGISFLPLGIVLTFAVGNPGFIGFIGLGLAYIAIGLANKEKWKKEE